MSSVNEINTKLDLTVRVFDQFNDFDIIVDANNWDVVFSFFKKVFSNEDAARNMATSLFRISQVTNTPVEDLLAQMANQNSIQVNLQMAYYLNTIRSPATLLGVSGPTTPNYYTARNVLP